MRPFRYLVLALLLLPACAASPTAPAEAGGPADQGPTVTIAAWNVANFFDTVDDANQDEVPSREQWEKKLAGLSTVVGTVEADFLALEEVENLACLQALNAQLERPYPQLGLIEGNDTVRGIDVAFMSRLPVSRVVSHRDHDLPQIEGVSANYKFSRDCLQVDLATQPPVTLFVNHFKSQLGAKKNGAAKRRVQAEGVREIARRARGEGALQVVLGDLNDRPGSWALEPLQDDFLDVHGGWPEPMRASHRSKHGATALDYIWVSREAAPGIAEPRVWQKLAKGTSDHDPVSVKLRLRRLPAGPVPQRTWK